MMTPDERKAYYAALRAKRDAEFREDVEWMFHVGGEAPVAIARRLGVNESYLLSRLRAMGAHDLKDALIRRADEYRNRPVMQDA